MFRRLIIQISIIPTRIIDKFCLQYRSLISVPPWIFAWLIVAALTFFKAGRGFIIPAPKNVKWQEIFDSSHEINSMVSLISNILNDNKLLCTP